MNAAHPCELLCRIFFGNDRMVGRTEIEAVGIEDCRETRNVFSAQYSQTSWKIGTEKKILLGWWDEHAGTSYLTASNYILYLKVSNSFEKTRWTGNVELARTKLKQRSRSSFHNFKQQVLQNGSHFHHLSDKSDHDIAKKYGTASMCTANLCDISVLIYRPHREKWHCSSGVRHGTVHRRAAGYNASRVCSRVCTRMSWSLTN